VDAAESLEAGLARVREAPPELLLLDLHSLDAETGTENLRLQALREEGRLPRVPIVALSTGNLSSRNKPSAPLYDALLTKPVSQQELYGVLAAFLETEAQTASVKGAGTEADSQVREPSRAPGHAGGDPLTAALEELETAAQPGGNAASLKHRMAEEVAPVLSRLEQGVSAEDASVLVRILRDFAAGRELPRVRHLAEELERATENFDLLRLSSMIEGLAAALPPAAADGE
jgi:CheY-like chemotaxis protein